MTSGPGEIVSKHREVIHAQTVVRDLKSKLSAIEDELAAGKAQIERLVTDEQRDAGKRLLYGVDAAPPNPRRQKKIGDIQQRQIECRAAKNLLRENIEEAEAKLAASQAAFVQGLVLHFAQAKAQVASRLKDAMAALAAEIIELEALEQAQTQLIGRRFTFTPKEGLEVFSGAAIAKKVVDSLAPRVRPPALEPGAFFSRSSARAAELVAQITQED